MMSKRKTKGQIHSSQHSLQESQEEGDACLDLLPSLVKVEDGALEPSPEKAQEAREHGEQRQEGAKSEASFPGLDEPVPDDWETIEGEYCFGDLEDHRCRGHLGQRRVDPPYI